MWPSRRRAECWPRALQPGEKPLVTIGKRYPHLRRDLAGRAPSSRLCTAGPRADRGICPPSAWPGVDGGRGGGYRHLRQSQPLRAQWHQDSTARLRRPDELREDRGDRPLRPQRRARKDPRGDRQSELCGPKEVRGLHRPLKSPPSTPPPGRPGAHFGRIVLMVLPATAAARLFKSLSPLRTDVVNADRTGSTSTKSAPPHDASAAMVRAGVATSVSPLSATQTAAWAVDGAGKADRRRPDHGGMRFGHKAEGEAARKRGGWPPSCPIWGCIHCQRARDGPRSVPPWATATKSWSVCWRRAMPLRRAVVHMISRARHHRRQAAHRSLQVPRSAEAEKVETGL